MTKIEEARMILTELNVPAKQQTGLCCYTLLAMANIKNYSQWEDSTNEWIRIHDIITYIKNNYNITYAENSRETFRKQALHHFRNAAFIEEIWCVFLISSKKFFRLLTYNKYNDIIKKVKLQTIILMFRIYLL